LENNNFNFFEQSLTKWYRQHKRDLPWRHTTDPYKIWLSEVILQQTRVAQGLPYYQKFVAQYPTIALLAAAPLDHVLRLWQGLGYYSRARNMHNTAQLIVTKGSTFPNSYKELLTLKGIGPYTAAAVASFAYNEPVAVLDGNVYRVLARLFDIDMDISTGAAQRYFYTLAQKLLPANSAEYNQSIMEFGAMQCTVKNPNCSICPLQDFCLAFKNKTYTRLPVKLKKIKIKKRYFYYFLIEYNGKYFFEKRPANDIWQELYQPYLIEFGQATEYELVLQAIKEKIGDNFLVDSNNFTPILHNLTHQQLYIYFLKLSPNQTFGQTTQWYSKEQIFDLPKPIAIAKYLNQLFS
jgi:A/G-specific adenine glycosylase